MVAKNLTPRTAEREDPENQVTLFVKKNLVYPKQKFQEGEFVSYQNSVYVVKGLHKLL